MVCSNGPLFTVYSVRRFLYFANFLLMSDDDAHGRRNSANVIDTLEKDPSKEKERKKEKKKTANVIYVSCIDHRPICSMSRARNARQIVWLFDATEVFIC